MGLKLYESIYNLAEQYNPPAQLKNKVVDRALMKKGSAKVKILFSAAFIAFAIPLFAFISQFYNADQLYGSYSQLRHQVDITMSEYSAFNDKIGEALQTLQLEDGAKFVGGLKNFIQFKMEHGEGLNSGIIISHLTADEYEQYYDIIATIQPYFDVLNGMKSSQDTLTEEQFTQYITSIMLQESIVAESNVGYEDYDYSRVAPQYEEQYNGLRETISQLESELRHVYISPEGIDYSFPQ